MPQTAQTFDIAPLDSYAERITTGVALVGGILMLPALFAFLSRIRADGVIISVAVAATLAVFLVLNYAVQPMRYDIEANRLVIRRRWWRRLTVEYSQILAVSEAPAMADLPRTGLRQSFNAGVFGYGGPFQLDPYGKVAMIATNRERLVAVARRTQAPLLISPARPKPFVDALREALAAFNTPGLAEREQANG